MTDQAKTFFRLIFSRWRDQALINLIFHINEVTGADF
jgi:hypothetical protein